MQYNFKAYVSAYHQEVTGSRFLLRIEFPDGVKKTILIDCGYFQEIEYRVLNYVYDIDPAIIDAVILTHNHIDHTGLVPKLVREGYNGPVYMTAITRELVGNFWKDCASMQEENAEYLKQKFPNDAWQFKPLYYAEDASKAVSLSVGLPLRKEIEIIPGRVYMTYYENGHLLGAGMVHLRITAYRKQDIEYFFTGDFKPSNPFFKVPPLPRKLLRRNLVIMCESTYGSTQSKDIKKCLKSNLAKAFREGKNILIGAFAQGRMQEILYLLKQMQEEGLIPSRYRIRVDGNLGLKTTALYREILSWYNPSMKDFLPEGLEIVDCKSRENILEDENPVVLVTTSGMLSNGPAVTYVPIFIQDPNSLIHLVGYAAEETLARELLEAREKDEITIRGEVCKKRATVLTTRECTSHATEDQLFEELLDKFENPVAIYINHGAADVQTHFLKDVRDRYPDMEHVDCINRNVMYQFTMNGNRRHWDLTIKKMPSGLSKFGLTKKSRDMLKERKKEKGYTRGRSTKKISSKHQRCSRGKGMRRR